MKKRPQPAKKSVRDSTKPVARPSAAKKPAALRTEILAGLTTFFTVSYILVLNPLILGSAGMLPDAVFVATALSAALATLLMGFYANRPFVLAAGMGLNVYFAYAVVGGLGVSWMAALAAVFVSGLALFLLSISKLDLGAGVPDSFKHALIAGLGLFLIFIGLQNAHWVISNPATLVAIGDLASGRARIAVIGFLATALLLTRRVPGSLLLGILIATIASIALGFSQPPTGIFQTPSFNLPLAFRLDLPALLRPSMFGVVWAFFIIALFDIVGTLTALSVRAGFQENREKNKLNKSVSIARSLQANALAVMGGALLGVSTIVTYLESAAGIEAGGRTGKVAIVAGLLFLLSLFFFPLVAAIPTEATAPVMILVGIFMLSAIGRIPTGDPTESLPAFLAVVIIPLTFSIAHGVALGSILYVFLKLVSGRFKEIPPVMYLIALLSLLDVAGVF